MKQLVSTHELAGNYTVVIDTVRNKVYLDALDEERPGITMESNMQGSLMMDVAEMFKKYNLQVFPNVYNLSDDNASSSSLYESFETVKYRTRTTRIENNLLRIFAPIILKTGDKVPDAFVLYRYDLSKEERTREIVAVVNLHNNNIADYIQPKDYSLAFIYGNTQYIKGVDSETGQFVKADLVSNNIALDEKDTESIIYQAYKNKKILYNNIINLSFVIKDDEAFKDDSETSAYLYEGRYASVYDAIDSSKGSSEITIESNWGSEEDTRKDIYIYKPKSTDGLHNRIEYIDNNGVPSILLNTENIILRQHDGCYEHVSFDNNGANVKYGLDQKSKYVGVDKYSYAISGYEKKLPSMTFEMPKSECTLTISMSLEDEFIHYVDAVNRIDIKWTNDIDESKNSNCILLSLSISAQIQKLKNILGTYFKVCQGSYNNKNIVTLTVRNDNVLNFNELKFVKTSRLNVLGVYSYTDITPESYRTKVYEYSFTPESTYAKVSNEIASDIMSNVKKYIELSGEGFDNTCMHDNVHYMFFDNEYAYINTTGYIADGIISGNTLNFYTMKACHLYSLEHIAVCDFIDIRTFYINNEIDGITDDSMPVDIKTRVAWSDFAALDKNGESLVPAVAQVTSTIDTSVALANTDSWSYGQILYNGVIDESDIYFETTHFHSDDIEDNCIKELFDDCFDSSYEGDKVEFVKAVMYCMYSTLDGKYAPLLVFKAYEDHPECIMSRMQSIFLPKGLTSEQITSYTEAVGKKMLSVSISTVYPIISSYLSSCSESTLNDISTSVTPTEYNGELMCMLFGVSFKTSIRYADYKFKSIIIPVPRFTITPEEDTKVYPNHKTIVIYNNDCRTVIISTFIDMPCIMPFSTEKKDSTNFAYATMFGSFTRSIITSIGTTGYTDIIDSITAFDTNYISAADSLNDNITYHVSKTGNIIVYGIRFLERNATENYLKQYIINESGSQNAVKLASNLMYYKDQNTNLLLAILITGGITSSSTSQAHPSKLMFYDENDPSTNLGRIFTVSADEADSDLLAYKIVKETLGGEELSSFETPIPSNPTQNGYGEILVYNDAYNRDVRALNQDNINNYSFSVSIADIIDPSDEAKIAEYKGLLINTLKSTLSLCTSYYYYNSLISDTSNSIDEFTAGTDSFIITSDGSFGSAITDYVKLQCYPTNSQLFTYDIVDDDAVKESEKYAYINASDPYGLLYAQYLTVFNDDSIKYTNTLENIFNTDDILTIPTSDNIDEIDLNYRTQRFISLVIYDKSCIKDVAANETNLNSLPSITSSKYYNMSNETWINYKTSKSSVDIKLYPSILYGTKIKNAVKNFIDNENITSEQILKYIDKFMFHLYDFDINMYDDENTDDFKLLSNLENATVQKYTSKKNYEQEYRNHPKRNVYFTFNMSLRS